MPILGFAAIFELGTFPDTEPDNISSTVNCLHRRMLNELLLGTTI